MIRKNSQESDWDRFDESILSVTSGVGRRRTESSGLTPSPCSTHSDRQPQLVTSSVTSPPPHECQPIPVLNQRVWTRVNKVSRHLPTLSAPEVRSSVPKIETSVKMNSNTGTDCNFCDNPIVDSKAHDPHKEALFSCAACGEQKASYEDISKHVQDTHVGDDMELVLASIIIPSNLKMLKEFKCGIKSCGRRFIGRNEEDLLDHIRNTHGTFYIKICKGRNLVRLCRICSGSFESDSALTDHILQWHPVSMFANEDKKSGAADLSPHPQDSGFNVVTREDTQEEPREPKNKAEIKRIRTSVPHMDLEKLSRKRKISESIKDRLTLTPTYDLKRSKKDNTSEETPQELVDPVDLKHKLRKIRETKNQGSKVFCEACCRSTADWTNHKYGLEHIKNDKKARCHFCPKRFWIDDTRNHMSRHHRGSSFTCNKCGIKLISLDKMTEHINTKHRDEVNDLIVRFGKYWESNFVSANHLGMNNFYLIPSDLRRLSCKVCGTFFLGQDQSALEKHFRLDHSHLARSQYTEHIRFECRLCSGVLFGSEAHLLKHFKEVHSDARLSIEMESDFANSEVDLRNVHVHKRNYESQVSKVDKVPKQSSKNDEKKVEEIASDSSCYVERVSTNLKFKRRKLLNTFKSKSNPVLHVKGLYSDYMSPANISTEDTSDSENTVVACNFCEIKMRRHQLDKHLKKVHKGNLFSCDGSCGHKVYSPWKHSLMSHLRTVHKLRSSDSKLCEKRMKLPKDLAIISCKAENCSEEAIFLARDVTTVRKMLTRHAEKRHRGLEIDKCFQLGCRVCTYVWGLGQTEEWTHHCRAHHDTPATLAFKTLADKRQETKEMPKANSTVSQSRSAGTRRQMSGKIPSDVNSNDTKALSLYLWSKENP